jgi:hypothetical protein
MSKVDTAHVNKVVHDMSKNSRFYARAKRNDASSQKRVDAIKRKLNNLRPNELSLSAQRVDARVAELERNRDLSRIWAVVDLDAFFANVELLSR